MLKVHAWSPPPPLNSHLPRDIEEQERGNHQPTTELKVWKKKENTSKIPPLLLNAPKSLRARHSPAYSAALEGKLVSATHPPLSVDGSGPCFPSNLKLSLDPQKEWGGNWEEGGEKE